MSAQSDIRRSRALSKEQKKDLQALAKELPGFGDAVADDLAAFDRRSRARERYLRGKLKETVAAFERKLVAEGVDEEKRIGLVAKAREQIEAFFPE